MLEAADAFGTGTSSRNSEVIHAGIYYPARLAQGAPLRRRAASMLYDYCEAHGVPHRRCGKLIVATSEAQLGELDTIRGRRAANGVELEQLSGVQAQRAGAAAALASGALHLARHRHHRLARLYARAAR